VKQVCALELHDVVCFAFFVNEQGEGDPRFVAKSTGVNAISKSQGGECCAAVPESSFVRAQLRDVLAAEDSPVVAQENNHGRLAEP
jgi:hypothetical protein